MPNPAWLETLAIELRRQRLPAPYSVRLMEELADHLVDVMEDAMSTGIARDVDAISRRMGTPREIAKTAATEYRRRGFLGRHRLFTFVTLPILAVPAVWALALAAVLGMAALWKFSVNHGWAASELSAGGVGALKFACVMMMVLPAIVAAWAFGRVAVRNGLTWRWPLVACTILGAFVAVAGVDTRWSMLPGKSQLMLSLGFGTGLKDLVYESARFAAPLAVAIWVLTRAARREPTAIAT